MFLQMQNFCSGLIQKQTTLFFFMIDINFACLIRDRGRVFQHCCISNILHKIPLW